MTVALFVSDVAFTNETIKGDAKLGALLSGGVGIVCWLISLVVNYREEDVNKVAELQLEEELEQVRA